MIVGLRVGVVYGRNSSSISIDGWSMDCKKG